MTGRQGITRILLVKNISLIFFWLDLEFFNIFFGKNSNALAPNLRCHTSQVSEFRAVAVKYFKIIIPNDIFIVLVTPDIAARGVFYF